MVYIYNGHREVIISDWKFFFHTGFVLFLSGNEKKRTEEFYKLI